MTAGGEGNILDNVLVLSPSKVLVSAHFRTFNWGGELANSCDDANIFPRSREDKQPG
jgi:hypothetical protein